VLGGGVVLRMDSFLAGMTPSQPSPYGVWHAPIALGVGIRSVAGGPLALAAVSPRAFAESLKITSVPVGPVVEINGPVVGTTLFHRNCPGCYFRKPHTVLASDWNTPWCCAF
jgi:hypothetical protein